MKQLFIRNLKKVPSGVNKYESGTLAIYDYQSKTLYVNGKPSSKWVEGTPLENRYWDECNLLKVHPPAFIDFDTDG